MNPSAPIGSLLTIGCCWGHKRGVNRFFANNCERPVVWAALCERSFEGIALARQMFEVQQKMHIRKKSEQFFEKKIELPNR